jgi:prepilin-type N-terminal cleavage/methylation domain-containing protein
MLGMTDKHTRHSLGFTLVELLVVIAIIAMLVTLLLPAVQSAREAARRTQCLNHLRQMGLGVLNYESARGVFPPGCVLDAPCCNNLKTYTGWTIEILPFMENTALNDLYDPRISVGSPEAQRFRETEIPEYVCPSDQPPQLLQPQSGPEAGWGNDRSRVWMMSSYRGNAGRSNGATTWYLAEDVDQSPLSWRGPLHYVPLEGTEDLFKLPLKQESLSKFVDGTSKTLLAAEQTNLVAERRSFWAHTFGNYIMSQATDQSRIFMNDYNACTAIAGTGGSRPCMVAWYSYHTGDGMNYVNCDGSGGFMTFAGSLEIFNARASVAGEEAVSNLSL